MKIKRRQKLFVLIVSSFSLVLIVMSLCTAITQTKLNDTAARLTNELEAAREENRTLTAQFESLHSLEEIEDYAVNELGMVHLSGGDIVVIEP